jgi:hypothetical protein
MDRDFARMPALHAVELPGAVNRQASRDLAIEGERSLFRLLDVGLANVGGARVLEWLLADPAPLDVIHARQRSVAALRERPDLLLENARLSRAGSHWQASTRNIGAFREWCARPSARLSPAVVALARSFAAVTLVAMVAAVFLPDLRRTATLALMGSIPANLVVAALARRHLRSTTGGSGDVLPALSAVIGVMRVIEAEPEVAGRFGEIQQSFISDDTSGLFSRLTRLFEWEAARHSPMLHAGLNALVAYDAHVAAAIDRWHAANGVRFPAALDLVADAQAMLALATLAYENPGWTMPLIHDGVAPMIAAAECGHPLIAGGARVPNPVALAGSGAVLIVSGSNMSGKTTYLRAVGLNILLALAGGPVCGAEMRVARCRVRTSVRIEDDLAAGMSLFYAEVARIRDVVGDAEVAGAPPVLFLLDEILHGTNAADRREATRLVLQRLIAAGAAGIITTHDPSVADGIPTGPGSGAVEQRHFTDAVTANGSAIDMTFDYAIRPGPATTTNALRILRLLGLDQDA